MITKPCPVPGGEPHVYPDDWIFGGANEVHPGADPRWQHTTYEYYDGKVNLLVCDHTPICDDVALDNLTQIAQRDPIHPPVYIFAIRPGEERVKLPWEYDAATDTVYPSVVLT